MLFRSGKPLDEWRRDNISRIVYQIYDRVKETKPWVKVSSAPLGRYRDIPGLRFYGWNAYGTVFQDACKWLNDGKQDLLVPMMYYKEELFYPYLKDWLAQSNGRPIVPGLGVYRLDEADANWSLNDIGNQIVHSRTFGAKGQALYRAANFTKNKKGIARLLEQDLYDTPVLYPPMDWVESLAPDTLSGISINDDENTIGWLSSVDAAYYTVYGKRRCDILGGVTYDVLEPVVYTTSWRFADNNRIDRYEALAVSASNCYHKEGKKSSDVSLKPKKCVYSHGLYKIGRASCRERVCQYV